MSIFHFCRTRQGASGGHWTSPKVSPTGTHWNSDDSITALSSVRPPSSLFNMPVTRGIRDSWACGPFIKQLFKWAGFGLYSYNCKSPQSLTSTVTDPKPCTHTTCNTHRTCQTRGLQLDFAQMSHSIQHAGQLMCWSTVTHAIGSLPTNIWWNVFSVFSAENPKPTKMYLPFFELQPESCKTSTQSPSTHEFQKDNRSPKSTEKLSSSCPEGFGLASQRETDQ